ncbi:MAG: hypothetical protein ABID09_03215 [Candidatus Omnitrophota bacterium]
MIWIIVGFILFSSQACADKPDKPDISQPAPNKIDANLSVEAYLKLDYEQKVIVITQLIQMFRESNGVSIGKPVDFYIEELDNSLTDQPLMRDKKLRYIFIEVASDMGDFRKVE